MSDSLALVLLAAGRGSRFGGPKQLAPVGPSGEPVFAVTARQAQKAGFERLVVVTTTQLVERMKAAADEFVSDMEVEYVCQDAMSPRREIPWGTAHAVGGCAPLLDGPAGVANGDDLYGDPSFHLLADHLRAHDGDRPPSVCIVSFELGRVLSPNGGVSRGICTVEPGGRLRSVVETYELARDAVSAMVTDRDGAAYADNTPTSMNLFGLGRGVATLLADGFDEFRDRVGDDPSAEYQLPTRLSELAAEGDIVIDVVASTGSWLGLTYAAELESVQRSLAVSSDWTFD